MNFLAIDTSGKHLSVIAYHNGVSEVCFVPDCAHAHSVRLMGEIDGALSRAGIKPVDCDFFAVTVGPGSFTGIRIGIATVKGLCFACEKPAVAITSFDCLAYAEKSARLLALVDAGHGAYYACGYGEGELKVPPRYLTEEEALALVGEGYSPVSAEALPIASKTVDPAKGLLNAVLKKCGQTVGAEALAALYLRKSSAEEGR